MALTIFKSARQALCLQPPPFVLTSFRLFSNVSMSDREEVTRCVQGGRLSPLDIGTLAPEFCSGQAVFALQVLGQFCHLFGQPAQKF